MSDSRFDRVGDFLLQEENYPEGGPVEFIQTHISCVYLTSRYAYKLLKPVNFGFLDFSTKEARRKECRNEIELNRRLTPDVYLDVVPIYEKKGDPTFDSHGEPVEWLIKMRKLDETLTLESRIVSDCATEEDIDSLLSVLIPFLQNAETNDEIAKNGEMSVIHKNATENFEVLESAAANGLLESSIFDFARSSQLQFLALHSTLFDRRIEENCIRHVHGDLRAEHIYFEDTPAIIDCIAFNERFRYNDVLDEICFLASDLEKLGREELAEYLTDSFRERMPDHAPEELVGFFKAYRHTVRAKVDCLRMQSSSERQIDRLREKTGNRLQFARAALEKFHEPFLLVLFGKSGTGKSTVARALSESIGAKLISSDFVRKEMFGLKATERGHPETVYSQEANERTYIRMFELGLQTLSNESTVILDATFQRADDRTRAFDVAESQNVELLFIECRCSDEIARSRIAQREKRNSDVSDAGVDVFQKQARVFESPEEIPANRLLVLDTRKEAGILRDEIVSRLRVL